MWQLCLVLAVASSRSVIAFPQNDGLAPGKVEIQTIPSTFSVDGFVFDGPADGRNVATATSTTSSATPSMTTRGASSNSQYDECIATCLTTSEYNPVCGSDDVEYSNPGQLTCASACGKDNYDMQMNTKNMFKMYANHKGYNLTNTKMVPRWG